MNTSPKVGELNPPRLIPSFITGFNTVANHIGLILLPIILDLLLWFGPHLRLNSLLQPIISTFVSLPGLDAPEMADLMRTNQEIMKNVAERFNLVSILRTYPVGVPSLMAGQGPLQTPLGLPPIQEVNSVMIVLLWWGGFVFVGLLVASIYYNQIARAVAHDDTHQALGSNVWVFSQLILLTLICLVLLFLISLPLFIVVPIVLIISPVAAQFVIIIMFLVLLWLLLPLFFSPHGIFLYRQNAFISMMTSARLVRFSLPSSIIFFLAIFLMSQGLDLLWQAPPSNSWMALVGVGGHAFIATGLLATTFVYYRDAMHWAQELLKRSLAAQKQSQV